MKKVKPIYNGGVQVGLIGRETEPILSTNDYVKCFHVDTSILKTLTIKLTNIHAANELTWKLTGMVDGLGGGEETITVLTQAADFTSIIVDETPFLKYSLITFYVKSKVEDSHAQYMWEFYATSN
jgi:hypothetical protein